MRYPAIVKPSVGIAFKAREGRPVIEAQTAGGAAGGVGARPRRGRRAAGAGGRARRRRRAVDRRLLHARRRHGELVGTFSGRKLAQMPPRFGTCRVGRGALVGRGGRTSPARCSRPSVTTESRRPSSSATRGTVRFRLMELNTRLWQWHSLARRCGVDLVAMAYRRRARRPAATGDLGPAPRRPPLGADRAVVARRPGGRRVAAAPSRGRRPGVDRGADPLAARPRARRPRARRRGARPGAPAATRRVNAVRLAIDAPQPIAARAGYTLTQLCATLGVGGRSPRHARAAVAGRRPACVPADWDADAAAAARGADPLALAFWHLARIEEAQPETVRDRHGRVACGSSWAARHGDDALDAPVDRVRERRAPLAARRTASRRRRSGRAAGASRWPCRTTSTGCAASPATGA